MKAPDKIYLLRNKIGVILNSWSLDSCNQLESIEYIRKDALLELEKEKARITKGRLISGGRLK